MENKYLNSIDMKKYYTTIDKIVNNREISNKEKDNLSSIFRKEFDYRIKNYVNEYNSQNNTNLQNLSDIIENEDVENLIFNKPKKYYSTLDDVVFPMEEYFKGKFKGNIKYSTKEEMGFGILGKAWIGTGLIEVLDSLYGKEKSSTIVHEIIHMLYPDKDESEVRLMEYILCGPAQNQESFK